MVNICGDFELHKVPIITISVVYTNVGISGPRFGVGCFHSFFLSEMGVAQVPHGWLG